ncbi:MAG: DUF1365 domain-containing protein [Betaproteobacteria bacterium]|nr:DUF1365 domain-containing protein [Betaproteobacteria bacterium]
MHSAIYTGWVRHRRYVPAKHTFSYQMSMFYLDLQEIDQLVSQHRWFSKNRFNWLQWRRQDYMGDASLSLYDEVKNTIVRETGIEDIGAIRQLTHPRYLGMGFNPVSFYYAFARESDNLRAIVAEVSNTPWLEKHIYVLPINDNTAKKFTLKHNKEFHVSPFLPMEMEYLFRISTPEETLFVHMENWQKESKVFDATLVLRQQPFSQSVLLKTLLRFPLMSWKVVFAIYWQATQLWLKKVPFYSHP